LDNPQDTRNVVSPSGSHLDRYAQRFTAVEIDSSFHRPHRRATYERWSATVPDGFTFSVKVPKEITHSLRLVRAGEALDAFFGQATGLGGKLGPLLLQLPPSLAFEARAVGSFFAAVRARFDGTVVCEPRHPDWFAVPADHLLTEFRISRVVADPPIVSAAAVPDGWNDVVYFRLHGSPHVYYSEYTSEQIEWYARQLADRRNDRAIWCIFDNTAAGPATGNALALQERVERLLQRNTLH
jgi:uncharacterized protein YecE (DUF72 family)